VDGVCFVRDGHHRISVARSLGQDFIEAEITEMNLLRRLCECASQAEEVMASQVPGTN